jgi:hypothetical protein
MNKFRFALLLLMPLVSAFAFGQKLVQEETYKVNGYSLSQMGYPKRVVPGEKGGFGFVEFWTQGEGRQFPNYYMQGYTDKIEEEWFRPVTKQGTAKLENLDVMKMKASYAVTGYQYSGAAKRTQLMAQLFAVKGGAEKGGLTQVSTYDKKTRKLFEDVVVLSPDSSKFAWMGHNPREKSAKHRVFFNVMSDGGQSLWKGEIMPPHLKEKYYISQSLVDNRGHVYMLLRYETATNTPKDTANLPIIVRYDYREKKFSEHQLQFPGASVPEVSMHLNQKGDLVVLGILADGSAQGFLNGEKSRGVGLKWNKIVYKKFNIERELHLAQEAVLDFPESALTRYSQRGANFSEFRTMESGKNVFWIMEEAYTQEHNGQLQFVYYDIATVAIDMEAGVISWASSFEKKQRDYTNGQMLSFTPGIANGALRFVYLTERGASGKIVCTNMAIADGRTETIDIALNNKEMNLFFPRRSAQVSPTAMILLGVGNPVGNEYKLMKIQF